MIKNNQSNYGIYSKPFRTPQILLLHNIKMTCSSLNNLPQRKVLFQCTPHSNFSKKTKQPDYLITLTLTST